MSSSLSTRDPESNVPVLSVEISPGIVVRLVLDVIGNVQRLDLLEEMVAFGVIGGELIVAEWQGRMKKACTIAGIPDEHFHRLRDTFSVRLLENGVPLETVAVLLGNTVQVCQKHYAPWVKSRQVKLEEDVKSTWG